MKKILRKDSPWLEFAEGEKDLSPQRGGGGGLEDLQLLRSPRMTALSNGGTTQNSY